MSILNLLFNPTLVFIGYIVFNILAGGLFRKDDKVLYWATGAVMWLSSSIILWFNMHNTQDSRLLIFFIPILLFGYLMTSLNMQSLNNVPKGELTALIIFTNEQRQKFKADNPDKSTTELTTLMSQEWRNMTDDEKKKYVDLSEVDKQRYLKEKEDYESNSDTSDTEAPKKKIKDPDAPKKNLNSYMHFSKVTRAKHPDVKHTAAALKVMWADLEDKSEFEDMAKADKERYVKEKKEYMENQ